MSHIKDPCFELNESLRPGGFHFVKIVYDMDYGWISAYLQTTVYSDLQIYLGLSGIIIAELSSVEKCLLYYQSKHFKAQTSRFQFT